MHEYRRNNPFDETRADKRTNKGKPSPGESDKGYPQYSSPLEIINIPGDNDRVLIECPGATLYHSGSDNVAAGVRFFDNDDPSKGHEIVGRPVHGPKHVRYRWVKKDDLHLIRRCQSCQDYTVRMRRKEGPDLYIPGRNDAGLRRKHGRHKSLNTNHPHPQF